MQFLSFYIELDKYLNSQQKIVELPLSFDDHLLINMLMHNVTKVKYKREIEISLQKCRTFERLPIDVKTIENNIFQEEIVYERSCQNERNTTQSSLNWLHHTSKEDMMKQDITFKNDKEESKYHDSENNDDQYESKSDESYSSAEKGSTSKSKDDNRKKSKSGRSRQMLSLRPDVMNKNLFRALRREWKELFDTFLNSSNLIQSKKQKVFIPNLEQFAEHLLSETSVRWEQFPDFNTKDFESYLGILTNFWAMKKLRNGREREKLDRVYSVLYSYSHIKFNEFVSIPEIKTLVKIIWEKQGIVGLIEGNKALLANKEKYEAHINKLLQSFN